MQLASTALMMEMRGKLQDEAAKIMDGLVTPIKVKLPGDADFTDKLHQSAPENPNLPNK